MQDLLRVAVSQSTSDLRNPADRFLLTSTYQLFRSAGAGPHTVQTPARSAARHYSNITSLHSTMLPCALSFFSSLLLLQLPFSVDFVQPGQVDQLHRDQLVVVGATETDLPERPAPEVADGLHDLYSIYLFCFYSLSLEFVLFFVFLSFRLKRLITT